MALVKSLPARGANHGRSLAIVKSIRPDDGFQSHGPNMNDGFTTTANLIVIQTENSRHGTLARRNGRLHELAALVDQGNGVTKSQPLTTNQR